MKMKKQIFLLLFVVFALNSFSQKLGLGMWVGSSNGGGPGGVTPTYYFANNGNDSNDGLSSSRPKQTLTALNLLSIQPGEIVALKSGDTFTGIINVSNSGTSGNPITYTSYGTGAKPVITGFTTITGWADEGGGVYSKTLAVESSPEIVTINGVQYAMGRTPNSDRYNPQYSDYYHIDSFTGTTSITDSECNSATNDWTGAEVVIRASNYWNWTRRTITSHSGTTINFATSEPNANGFGYFIQNDIRTLDQFGEWYYGGGKIYMFFGGTTPSAYSVKVSAKNNLVNINSKNYISIDNIAFEGANISAIKNGDLGTYNTAVKNCSFDFNKIGVGGSNFYELHVSNSSFKNTSSQAIAQDGSDGSYIGYNTIDSTGIILGINNDMYAGNAITVINSTHNNSAKNTLVENNNINNSGSSGIVYSGDLLTIKNNNINTFNINKVSYSGIIENANAFNNSIYTNNATINKLDADEKTGLPYKFINTVLFKLAGGTLVDGDEVGLAKFDNVIMQRFNYNDIGGNTYAAIKAINPNTKIFLYQLGTESNDNQDGLGLEYISTLARWNISRGHSMGNLNVDNSDLFLLDSNGDRIYNSAFPHSFLFDPNSDYKDYWIEATANDIVSQPWKADGIFMDICAPLQGDMRSGISVKYSTNALFSAAVDSFISTISGEFYNLGQKIGANYGNTNDVDGRAAALALNSSDNPPYFTLEESAFATSWYGSGVDVAFEGKSIWKEQIDLMKQITNYKPFYLNHTKMAVGGTGVDNFGESVTFWEAFYYALGSYVLGKQNNSYFGFPITTAYNSIDWFDEYDNINFGQPLGDYNIITVGGKEIFMREFETGYVYVNPNNTDNVTGITLSGYGKLITHDVINSDFTGLPIINTFNLDAHRAAFILKSEAPVFAINPISVYTLNGNVLDTVGVQHGTNGGATSGATGKFGTAYDFEANQKITFPISTGTLTSTSYAVSFYVKLDVLPSVASRSYTLFYDVQTGPSYKAQLYISSSNTIYLTTRNTVPTSFISTSVTGAINTTGVWYHVVINIPAVGQAGEIYINGSKSTGTTNAVITGTDKISNGNLYLGDYLATPVNSLDGQIDEFEVYNRWLTPEEISYMNGKKYPY